MDSSSEPSKSLTSSNISLGTHLSNYWDLYFGIVFMILAILFHYSSNQDLATLFSALAIGSFSVTVAEIAEIIAVRIGEPYGSFVLTFSAVIVEILLLYMIILQGTHSAEALTTVKGAIISAVLVDMNVLLGIAVFVGGLNFKQQTHNEDTSSSYVTILLVTAAILLVPSILKSTEHDSGDILLASYMIGGLLFVFYFFILVFQTKTHIHFFKATAKSRIFRFKKRMALSAIEQEEDDYIYDKFSNTQNFIVLFIIIFVIGFLAEIFATDGINVLANYGVSPGIAGILIAIVAVAPEIFTAIKAAKNDEMQRVVNIAMGASTVSILLAVPILIVLAAVSNIEFTLDFNPLQIGALMLTIILAWKTTDDGQTNYLEGISHLVFFMAYAIIAMFY